jgi:hypothetical protein
MMNSKGIVTNFATFDPTREGIVSSNFQVLSQCVWVGINSIIEILMRITKWDGEFTLIETSPLFRSISPRSCCHPTAGTGTGARQEL